jgi:hypothetical protein
MASLSTSFAPIKIFVTINTRGVRGPEIRVLHAQESFYSTFRYSPRDLPMFLFSLISEINDRRAVATLDLALITGANANVDLILRDKFNEDLSCQVSVAAGCTAIAADSRTVSGRFTVVTVRSAARITDDSAAIGLMVQDPVHSFGAHGGSNGSGDASQNKKAKSCDVPCADSDV